jgi:hypothetical protein
MGFAEWEAAIAAGATLDELYKWDSGGYTRTFKSKVIAWHNMHSLVELHKSDAAERAAKRK